MIDYSVKNRSKHIVRTLLIVFVVGVIVLVGSAYVVRRSYHENLRAVSSDSRAQQFVIATGSTAGDIAESLKQEGLIRNTWAFEWYVRVNGLRDRFLAGTYELSPSQSTPEIVADIVDGNISEDLVTILPGQRLGQIRQSLISAGFAAADVDRALDPALYAGHPALSDKPDGASLEGYIYPETFQKTSETRPEAIIRESLNLMNIQLSSDVRSGFAAQGVSTHEAIIIASVVEKEISKEDERPIVAQVFLKRYREGIPLGSDATARYGAVIDGVVLPEDVVASDSIAIAHDSPYNTRIHAGLPPGPIGNVTGSFLRAVAFPSNTDYLFFVTGDDGVTHFSRTASEHEAAVSQYCIERCGRL